MLKTTAKSRNPKTVPARGRLARRVIDRAPRFQSWHTTDEQEIERRKQRAAALGEEIGTRLAG